VVSFTPRPLYPLERAPSTHCIGGWVDPTTGLDNMEKWKFLILPGLEPRPLSRPAHSQSLYLLLVTKCNFKEGPVNPIIRSRTVIIRRAFPSTRDSILNASKDTGLEIYSYFLTYKGCPKKYRPFAQVNELHHFKINGLQQHFSNKRSEWRADSVVLQFFKYLKVSKKIENSANCEVHAVNSVFVCTECLSDWNLL
jgi:hypothetical protein